MIKIKNIGQHNRQIIIQELEKNANKEAGKVLKLK